MKRGTPVKAKLLAGIAAILVAAVGGCVYTWRPNWWRFYERGLSRASEEQTEEAAEDFETALGKRKGAIVPRPNDARRVRTYGMHFIDDYFPHRELGVAYYRTKRFAEAEQELLLSLNQTPSAKAKAYLNFVRRELLRQKPAQDEPPTLTLKAPSKPYLNSRRMNLTGVAESKNYVSSILVNGERLFVELAEQKASFSKEVRLKPGANKVMVKAVDLVGKTSQKELLLNVDMQYPAVAIENAVRKSRDTVTISGVAIDNVGVAELTVAGRRQAIKLPSTEAPFSLEAALGHTIKVEVTDIAGNTTAAEVAVSADMLQPAGTGLSISDCGLQIADLGCRDDWAEGSRRTPPPIPSLRLCAFARSLPFFHFVSPRRQGRQGVRLGTSDCGLRIADLGCRDDWAEKSRTAPPAILSLRLCAFARSLPFFHFVSPRRQGCQGVRLGTSDCGLRIADLGCRDDWAEKSRTAPPAILSLRLCAFARGLPFFHFVSPRRQGRQGVRLGTSDLGFGISDFGMGPAASQSAIRKPESAIARSGPVLLAMRNSRSVVDSGGIGLSVAEARAGGDRKPPVISIRNVADGRIIYDDKFIFDVQASDNGRLVSLSVNGEDVLGGRTVLRYDRSFRADLAVGVNRFTVVAVDKAGNRAEKSFRIIREVQEPLQEAARLTLALLPLEEKGIPGPATDQIYDLLVGSFVQGKRFNFVERSEAVFSRLLTELKIGSSELADPAIAVRIGHIKTAEGMLYGKTIEYERSIAIDLWLVDTETSEIAAFADVYSEEGKSRQHLRWLAEGLALKFRQRFPLVRGRVTGVTKSGVFIDNGLEQGIRTGMKYLILKEEGETGSGALTTVKVNGRPLEARTQTVQAQTCFAAFSVKSGLPRIEVNDPVITK